MSNDADQVAGQIRTIIAEQAGRDPAELGDDTELAAIGIESLDAVEIIFAVEDRFGIDIPYNANAAGAFEMTTVGAVIRSVEGLINAP